MSEKKILILGIGNLLWADEGFGVRCVELLNERYRFPDHVRLLDGGTQGLYLVPHVQDADVLLVFDAVDYGLTPGTLKVVEDGEVPKFMGAKQMSLHQTGFQEVLAMAEFTGSCPGQMRLIGVQPQILEDFGGSLTPMVKAQLEPALDIALEYLASLGVVPVPLSASETVPEVTALAPRQLALDEYEAGRPDEMSAFRSGDIRFIAAAASDKEAG